LQRFQDDNRFLAFTNIRADSLSSLAFIANHAEQIILQLEGRSSFAAKRE